MSQDISWDLYRTFGAVLREGSLSGAARRLGLTQPSVAVVAASDPELTRVLPKAFAPELETWVVMHEDMRTNGPCRVVFDALAADLAALCVRARSS